jgi:hypothetical protein
MSIETFLKDGTSPDHREHNETKEIPGKSIEVRKVVEIWNDQFQHILKLLISGICHRAISCMFMRLYSIISCYSHHSEDLKFKQIYCYISRIKNQININTTLVLKGSDDDV